jgi:hypothetical protein
MTHNAPRAKADPGVATGRLDRAIDCAITFGLVVLILVGFAASYRTLRDLAASVGGYPTWLAPAIPLSFDLGIVVLSLKVARAEGEGLNRAGLSGDWVIQRAGACGQCSGCPHTSRVRWLLLLEAERVPDVGVVPEVGGLVPPWSQVAQG